MKKRFKNWIYRLAKKIIAYRIVNYENRLTPQFLIERGWELKDGYYSEPNMKDRDRISVSFENHYYRVWHSDKRTFIALQSSLEWFEMYYLLSDPHKGCDGIDMILF